MGEPIRVRVRRKLLRAIQRAANPLRTPRLIVVDNVFPNPTSGFRRTEFVEILRAFPRSEVRSSGEYLHFSGEPADLKTARERFALEHPDLAPRVQAWCPDSLYPAAGFYCLFANGANDYLHTFERHRCGFAFTLYPGGGFLLNDSPSDARLARVFGSPSFRHVFVTQRVTRDYVLDKKYCHAEQMTYIPGNVVEPRPKPDLTRPVKANERHLAFVAHKYTPRGEDKGYDRFLDVARLLFACRSDVVCHVVGPFGPDDIPLGDLEGHIRFHGPRPASWLPGFFVGIDVILSPNVPFVLGPGAFDGFPTGCCVDGGLSGAIVVCTDELKENDRFEDGRDLVIVPPESKRIAERLDELFSDPLRMADLSRRGTQAFHRLYSTEAQLTPRIAKLRELFPQAAGPNV